MPTALVTGANRGIGRAVAERLGAEGLDGPLDVLVDNAAILDEGQDPLAEDGERIAALIDAGRTPEQAAEHIAALALLPTDGPSGGFVFEGRPEPW